MGFQYSCYISYPSAPGNELNDIVTGIYGSLSEQLGLYLKAEIFLDRNRLGPGEFFENVLAQALFKSVCLVPIITPVYFLANRFCLREFIAMERLEKDRLKLIDAPHKSLILPIVVRGWDQLPSVIKSRQLYNFDRIALRGRRYRTTTEYKKTISEIAKYVAERCNEFSGFPDAFESEGFALPTTEEVNAWVSEHQIEQGSIPGVPDPKRPAIVKKPRKPIRGKKPVAKQENQDQPATGMPLRIGQLRGAGNDAVATEDQLGFKHYVEAFAALIRSPYTQTPLTIGIFGSWGMGKTFLLQNIEAKVNEQQINEEKKDQRGQEPSSPSVRPVRFNAWEYSASEIIWPALAHKIMKELEPRKFFGHYFVRFWRNLKRLMQNIQGQLIVASVIIAATGLIIRWRGGVRVDAIQALLAVAGVAALLKLSVDTIFTPLGQWITTLLQDSDYGKHIEYMVEIKDDLGVLVKRIETENSRILVIIDDLDRCEPGKAVEVLQAIKLLLDFKVFIVCLGIDARIITRAVEQHYQNLLGPAGASGYEYLDKIVQIPFRIPEPGPADIEYFIERQMSVALPELRMKSGASESKTKSVEKETSRKDDGVREQSLKAPIGVSVDGDVSHDSATDNPDVANDAASTAAMVAFTEDEKQAFQRLSRYLRPNPRHLKRLVNVYRLVRTLAEFRNEQAILSNPVATIQWLVMCGQWPYTSNAMLEEFDGIAERNALGKAWPKTDPLMYLFEHVSRSISRDNQGKLDYDPELLRLMLQLDEGRARWEQVSILRKYTINFNPAIEAEAEVFLNEPKADDTRHARQRKP